MLEGLRAVWRGLKHFNQRGYIYVWANVLWFALTVPLVTAPAAFAGLARLSYVAHREPTTRLDEFWAGFRAHLRGSLLLGVLNIALVVMAATNFSAYAGAEGLGMAVLRSIWLVTLVLWFTAQLFGWCFICAMRQPTIPGALRNAAVMMLRSPGFTLGTLLGIALILVLSTLLTAAWFLITGSMLAAVANSVVQDRLRAAGYEAPAAEDNNLMIDPQFGDM